MKLTVGILSEDIGWHILLQQIGVDWEVCTTVKADSILSDSYAVIIVNSSVPPQLKLALSRYLDSGGAIVDVNGNATELLNSRTATKYFTSLHPSDLIPYPAFSMLDIFSNGKVIKQGQDSFVENSKLKIQFAKRNKGYFASIPFDIGRLIVSRESKRKNFFSDNNRLPNEVVAKVSKGELRKIVTAVLENLFHRRELPFIHKWYYPDKFPTIFTFRVDSDKGSQQQIEELYRIAEQHSIPTMWFLDVQSHEQWLSYFKKFKKQEIGVHCYYHRTVESYEENLNNFKKAQTLIQQEGLSVAGISAPYGKWNIGVARSFEILGFQFSSEFSLDYDDLPFFPAIDQSLSKVLQIPIHPISIGTMLRSRFSLSDMISYYKRIVDICRVANEPICLYHHPTHYHNDVFESIFSYVRQQGIPSLSYSEFAEWWKLRDSRKTSFEYNTQTKELHGTTSDNNPSQWYRISFTNTKELFIPFQRSQILDETQATCKPDFKMPDERIRRTRDFDWRHYLIDMLEFYSKRKI